MSNWGELTDPLRIRGMNHQAGPPNPRRSQVILLGIAGQTSQLTLRPNTKEGEFGMGCLTIRHPVRGHDYHLTIFR